MLITPTYVFKDFNLLIKSVTANKLHTLINLSLPSVTFMQRSAKILILFKKGSSKKFLFYVPKNYERKNSGSSGLKKIKIYNFV